MMLRQDFLQLQSMHFRGDLYKVKKQTTQNTAYRQLNTCNKTHRFSETKNVAYEHFVHWVITSRNKIKMSAEVISST